MRLYQNLTIKQKQIVRAWAFLALPVLFYGVIRFYPTGTAFVISFQEWNLLGDRTWTGFDNYVTLWNDPVFWKVFRNTFAYLLIGTPVSTITESWCEKVMTSWRLMRCRPVLGCQSSSP